MIERALVSILRSEPIASLVGNRVFSQLRPESGSLSALPAIVYSVEQVERIRSFDGHDGLTRAEIDLELFATSYRGVVDLFDVVRLWVDDYRGTVDGVTIKDIRVASQNDMTTETSTSGNATGIGYIFGRLVGLSVWYLEPVPATHGV